MDEKLPKPNEPLPEPDVPLAQIIKDRAAQSITLASSFV